MELKKRYNIPYGLSDQTLSGATSISAVTLGAQVIEKHFTTNKDLPGRDNKFALAPDELKRLCDFRDNLLKMQEDRGLDFQKCEEDVVLNYRGRWTSNE